MSVGGLPQAWVGARVENLPQIWAWALPWMLKSYHKPKQAYYHGDSLQKWENKNLSNEQKKNLQATQAKKKEQKKKGKGWENTWNCQNCQISQERRKAAIKHEVKLKH